MEYAKTQIKQRRGARNSKPYVYRYRCNDRRRRKFRTAVRREYQSCLIILTCHKNPLPSLNFWIRRNILQLQCLPVDYPFRFSDPVTPPRPPRPAWRRTRPHLPARPFASIKTHSSPAAFPTTLSLHFFLPSTFLIRP